MATSEQMTVLEEGDLITQGPDGKEHRFLIQDCGRVVHLSFEEYKQWDELYRLERTPPQCAAWVRWYNHLWILVFFVMAGIAALLVIGLFGFSIATIMITVLIPTVLTWTLISCADKHKAARNREKHEAIRTQRRAILEARGEQGSATVTGYSCDDAGGYFLLIRDPE